jgi:PAS domain S-box-containing protein
MSWDAAVPGDLRHAIFERFRQADGSAERQRGGTGLGLAIVREFVGLHGGAVEVQEAVGGGAAFVLDVPLVAPAGTRVSSETARVARDVAELDILADLPGEQTAPVPSDGDTRADNRPRILVVEDNPDMNSFLAGALGRNYWITRAFEGEEGLKRALADPPDLILSDVMMPRMSGDRMVGEIRRHPALDDVPIVMLTAKADDALRANLLRHGVQHYIHKPFSIEELSARVESVLAERGRTQRRLRQSEERYRMLFNSIDQGFCIIEMKIEPGEPLDFRFLEVNRAFEQQSGLTGATDRWMRDLRPDAEEHWFEMYRDVALTGTPVRFEQYANQLEKRWFEVYAFRVGAPEQKRVGVLFTNVSERKRAEHALRESEERFRTLADNIAQLAWMTDGSGSIVWYNRRWYEYTGTSFEQVRGWGWRTVHHPDHVERVVERITRSFESGDVWEDTFPLRAADGSYRWFLSRALPIRNADGDIVRWFGTNTDITEQKNVEVALRRSNDDLQQFAYVASHDLQEPLRTIASFTTLLARRYAGRLDSVADQYVEWVVTAANRMSQLIRDILAYTVAVNEQARTVRRTDCNEALQTVISQMDGVIRENGAEVTPDLLPVLDVDPGQLATVFRHLLSNSIKFARPTESPRVHFSARSDGATSWVFSVEDNGVGFDPRYSEQIFGIFKRLHGAHMPGTGIGLAICKAIIERHGGRIWAKSEPGRGATFYFTLPATLEEG